MIEAKVELDARAAEGGTPTFVAAQDGHLGALRVLLGAKDGLNIPMDNGSSPLFMAAQQGHLDIAKALVDDLVKGDPS